MILDNICDKRKEQLERDISKVSRQDIKAMAAERNWRLRSKKTFSLSAAPTAKLPPTTF